MTARRLDARLLAPRLLAHEDLRGLAPEVWLARLKRSVVERVQGGLTYPDFPSAEQWHSHIAAYVERFGLADSLKLGTGIAHAAPTADGWLLTTEAGEKHDIDHLVIANGVFCAPRIPQWPGADIHARAGGVVKAPSQRLTKTEATDPTSGLRPASIRRSMPRR